MTKYLVDFQPYDWRIEIDATSPEEAVQKFKNMNNFDIISNAYPLDGLHDPLEPFLLSTEKDEEYLYWDYSPETKKLKSLQ